MEQSPSHTVFNQTPPLTDYNLFATDPALQEAVLREGAGGAAPDLGVAGSELGAAASQFLGRHAVEIEKVQLP